MRILFALTYYRPHVSGLTIYVERLAHALAKRGHEVTVLTSRYDASLPAEERDGDVRVVRVPVAWRISKGVVMPSYPLHAWREIRQHDVLSIHLPQFEASLLAFLARLAGRGSALTYHCDLQLPPGLFNRIVDQVVFVSNYVAGLVANAVVAYTEDYATHSRFLSKLRRKTHIIPPPVVIPQADEQGCQGLCETHGLEGKKVIGFAARFAAEKGVEYLLGAIPYIRTEIPDFKILFAGEYENVLGERVYERLQPTIEKYKDYISFLGVLSPQKMADFFSICDVTVLPSVNSTESFGLVQVESMMCGTPVVASNLPGVRVPTGTTGMGETVPIRNEVALAEAIVRVINNRDQFVRPREEIEQTFSLETTLELYEQLFAQLKSKQG